MSKWGGGIQAYEIAALPSVARNDGSSATYCHCEESSDEAISSFDFVHFLACPRKRTKRRAPRGTLRALR